MTAAVPKKHGCKAAASYVARAKAAWGDQLPDWVMVLARATDAAASQGVVAAKVGCSASAISTVISKTYPGRMDAIEAKVRGSLMSAVVECPALGFAIARDVCARNQQSKMSGANPKAAKFPRACKSC